jgi:putative SOS response-associated peptidase YedK
MRHSEDQVAFRFHVDEVREAAGEHYNIAPTQQVDVVTQSGGVRRLETYKWGLIPSWAEDPKIGSRMLNARAETLTEKPSFRIPLAKRRCLIPADGFYEWKREGRAKQPFYFHRKDDALFAFAGLWEEWHGPQGPVRSVTVITTTANEVTAPVHDRMPVIVQPESEAFWLDMSVPVSEDLLSVLQPYPAEWMEAYPVSPMVNSAAVDDAECIVPVHPI